MSSKIYINFIMFLKHNYLIQIISFTLDITIFIH
jgi:hypothetical protein